MNALSYLKRAANVLRQSMPGRHVQGTAPKKSARVEASGGLKDFASGLKEGERLLREGKAHEAEQWYSGLLAQVDAKTRRGRREILLLALAGAQWRQKKSREAAGNAAAALEGLDPAQAGTETAECSELLAEIALDQGENETGVRHRKRALEVQLELRQGDKTLLIERRRKLAAAYRLMMQWDAAREQLRAAVEEAQRECGERHALTADCQVDLGTLEAAAGNGEEARRVLEQALEIHVAVCGAESDQVVCDFRGLAEVCIAVEDLEGAIRCYERALYIRERQLGGSSTEMAALLMDMGGTLSMLGRYGPAVEFMLQAVGRFEGLRDERLAPSLDRLGTVYLLSGRTEDSIKALKKARAIYEQAPDRFQNKLDQNADLLTIVSGYLSPKDASALMVGIGPPGVDMTAQAQPAALPTAPPTGSTTALAAGPTRKRAGEAEEQKPPLPETPEGMVLETWSASSMSDPATLARIALGSSKNG